MLHVCISSVGAAWQSYPQRGDSN